jgi:20S proteasome alpha/beta subunit
MRCDAHNTLQNEYAEGMSIEDCLQLAVKVLNKTMDSTAPAADKMELTTIQRINGKVLTPYNVYSLALLNI